MNALFKAARLHDGGAQLESLLQSSTVDLTRPDPLHPIFCVESVEALEALLRVGVPADLVDSSGYCAASLVFGRRRSTALLACFLKHGVDPWRSHPRLHFTLFDFALRRGSRADLELLVRCCGPESRALMESRLDRALDNYNNAFDVAALFGEQMCTRVRMERALANAREDEDFYAVVGALVVQGSREWLQSLRPLFERTDRAALARFLLPRWSERIHWFCGAEFGARVECLFMAMQRLELQCDSLARHELVRWLARGDWEILMRARAATVASSTETSSTSEED